MLIGHQGARKARMASKPDRTPSWTCLARVLAVSLAYLVVSLLILWGAVALYFDLPRVRPRYVAIAAYLLALLAIFCLLRRPWLRLSAWTACFVAVLVWWLCLKPSNDRAWQLDVSRTAWAEVHNDQIVIHDVRNCEYRSEFDYICSWETRSYDLSRLRGLDAYFVYWGSPWISHTMVSFQFGKEDYIAFSIETRKEVGETYSAVTGFFRQYELIYIAADERDLVRLRTNYRKDENVYLYHLAIDAARARQRFLEYIARLNELHEQPEWYNALTRNCTTNIFEQRKHSGNALPQMSAWNWRVLLNGKLDELLYREGAFSGNLPFEELRRRAYINPAAQKADRDPEFSVRIREGLPGFENEGSVSH